jgi:hypothetical protein
MGLPMTYLATISYKDGTGRSHSEETVLDLEAYIGTGGITRRRLHDIHKQLERSRRTSSGGPITPGSRS